ncbi:MAG: GNAT family N-acetyltransferase [Oscillochloridaceae bacterium umkhey_bin13]
MELLRFSDVAAFVARVQPCLQIHEAHNNLLLGMCHELSHNPTLFGPQVPLLRAVEHEGELVLVALQTPPRQLVLSQTDDQAALVLLANSLAAEGHELPGVQGPQATAEAFAQHWATVQQVTVTPKMNLRIYQLTAVRPPPPVSGQMRRATEADRPLLEAWFVAFQQEATPDAVSRDFAHVVTYWLTSSTRYLALWEDGEPVALAGATGPTPNGIRIGAVYTPPERRRRGYASALVANLSQAQLAAGKRFCFLFTDLSNPTSNHIYQAIGYEPVVDVVELVFRA